MLLGRRHRRRHREDGHDRLRLPRWRHENHGLVQAADGAVEAKAHDYRCPPEHEAVLLIEQVEPPRAAPDLHEGSVVAREEALLRPLRALLHHDGRHGGIARRPRRRV